MNVNLFDYSTGEILPHGTQTDIHPSKARVVLGFGDKSVISQPKFHRDLKRKFPNAEIAICSTAGDICNQSVTESNAVITAMYFEKTWVKSASIQIKNFDNSFDAGVELVSQLDIQDLNNVLILSDGELVNGSQLLEGIESKYNGTICVTGGLAGDGIEFMSTCVGLNDQPTEGNIVAIGFYGNHLQIGHGTMGGWEPMGRIRTVTASKGNELFELDGRNALEFYQEYLGPFAANLPSAALLFPLCICEQDGQEDVVRSILSINFNRKTITLAGDIPIGSKVRFMTANFDNIIDAAAAAANKAFGSLLHKAPDYALIISCVGRKMILNHRVEEEVEAVAEIFNKGTVMSGFYAYGELAPKSYNSRCHLHNQSMTITTFTEF
jgi:hypothetical protein